MAKTFKDVFGNNHLIIEGGTFVDTNFDIVTGKITGYTVSILDSSPVEVSETVYDAVKEYIEQ